MGTGPDRGTDTTMGKERFVKHDYLDPMSGKGPFAWDPRASRPDIVFISTDMVPPEFYGRFPDFPRLRTPNLDALRSGGVEFTNAFASSPLCTPSRASYLTGRYSYITTNSERSHDGHAIHLRDSDTIFPEYLRRTGYHARHVGKSHVGMHKFMDAFGENDAPWDRWSPPWYDDDEYIAYLSELGLGRFGFKKSVQGRSPDGGPSGNHYGGWIADQNGKPFPREATYPFFLVHRAIRALEAVVGDGGAGSGSRGDRASPRGEGSGVGRRPGNESSGVGRRPGNEGPGGDGPDVGGGEAGRRRAPGRRAPLYLQLDFFGPHQPFAIPAGLEERERELRAELELPGSYRTLLENGFSAVAPEPRIYRMYRRNWGLTNPETVIDYMVANALQFELIDEALGRLFAYLKERGIYDESWIIFIADHGEMNGESALIDKGAFLNPQVMRVPIFMKPPQPGGAGTHAAGGTGSRMEIEPGVVETPVSLVDLAPTILELAGIDTTELRDGVSLLRTLRDGSRPEEYPILFEIWSHVMPNPSVGFVFHSDGNSNGARHEGLYLFTYNATDDIDELYAIGRRRGLENLYNRPEYAGVADEAVEKLYRIVQRDQRFRSYRSFIELEYPQLLSGRAGDRQHFV